MGSMGSREIIPRMWCRECTNSMPWRRDQMNISKVDYLRIVGIVDRDCKVCRANRVHMHRELDCDRRQVPVRM